MLCDQEEENTLPAISLIDFIDFVLKVGTAKVTKVVEVKNHPAL